MRLIALNRLSIPSIGRDFSPLSLPFDPCPSFSRSNDHVLRNTWLFHVRLQREPHLEMLTENCYNSPVLCFHVTVYVITRFEYAPNEKFSYDDRKSEPFETEEKYDKNISNYRITPLVEREGSSIRVTSISPFLPFDQLFSCPPLRTICMNNESLNESWRREVDEKIRNVRDACVEARVLITNICIYVCVYIFDDTPEAFAFRKLYV